MLSKRIVLATAGVLFCLSSFVSAQDFSHLGQSDFLTAANTQSRSAVVSSLPSEVLQGHSATVVSDESYQEETSAAHQADFLVLLGLGGAVLAGCSLAGICLVLHKRSAAVKKPVTLVGV